MKVATLTKHRQGVRKAEKAGSGLDTFAKTSITVMGGVSAVIALWAVACLIGGMLTAGGPVHLAYSWFRAVSGL